MIACLDQYMHVFGQATVKTVEKMATMGGILKHEIKSKRSMSYGFDAVSMKWSEVAEMPLICSYGSAVALLNKIYVIGGIEKLCMCLNPYLSQWTILSMCSLDHTRAPAVVLKGRILLCGGQKEPPQSISLMKGKSVVEEYDPSTDTWRVSDLKLSHTTRSQFIFAIENPAKYKIRM